MPKVLMLKTAMGANDGIQIKEYVEGQSYELSDCLAKNFIAMQVGELVSDEPIAKAVQAAPQNNDI